MKGALIQLATEVHQMLDVPALEPRHPLVVAGEVLEDMCQIREGIETHGEEDLPAEIIEKEGEDFLT